MCSEQSELSQALPGCPLSLCPLGKAVSICPAASVLAVSSPHDPCQPLALRQPQPGVSVPVPTRASPWQSCPSVLAFPVRLSLCIARPWPLPAAAVRLSLSCCPAARYRCTVLLRAPVPVSRVSPVPLSWLWLSLVPLSRVLPVPVSRSPCPGCPLSLCPGCPRSRSRADPCPPQPPSVPICARRGPGAAPRAVPSRSEPCRAPPAPAGARRRRSRGRGRRSPSRAEPSGTARCGAVPSRTGTRWAVPGRAVPGRAAPR